MSETANKYKNKIITVPNILSFFRLCLIPPIVWLYYYKKKYIASTALLLVSGATDVIDGIIARKFDMISDFGKAFDPVADKLTQLAMLFCLATRFPDMMILFVVLTVKEIFAAILNTVTAKKTGEVVSAVWHGKTNTVLLYSVIMIHLLWYNIPRVVSVISVIVCLAMMVLSGVLYSRSDIQLIKKQRKG